MSQELKDKLKDAIGALAHAQYEGQMVAFAGFYMTPDGQVKNIVACESGMVLPMLGAVNILENMLMSSMQLKRTNPNE